MASKSKCQKCKHKTNRNYLRYKERICDLTKNCIELSMFKGITPNDCPLIKTPTSHNSDYTPLKRRIATNVV